MYFDKYVAKELMIALVAAGLLVLVYISTH